MAPAPTRSPTPVGDVLPDAPGAAGDPSDDRPDRAVLRALVRLASLVTASHDALSTIEAVAETACELLGAATVSIASRDETGGALTTLVNVGDLGPGEERWPTDERYDVAQYPVTEQVFGAGRYRVALAHVDDPASDPAEVALLRALGKTSCLNAPIVVDGELWGLLYASRDASQPRFDAYTAEVSEVVAGLVAAGLVQAAAWQQLQLLASTDPLTGLANRRVFDDRLRELLDDRLPGTGGRRDGGAAVRGPRFALVLADVDGLKRVNDGLGHPAGDEALLAVADAARRAVRDVPDAVAARLGGDEYALLLPGAGPEQALAVATAWCRECRDGRHGTSLSAGVVVVDGGDHLPSSVFGRADRALYAAKLTRGGTPVLAGP